MKSLAKLAKFANFVRTQADNVASAFLTNIDSNFVVRELSSPNATNLKTHYELRLALPGFDKEQVSISYEGDVLTVAAKSPVHGEVTESLQMDSTFDPGLALARMSNGLLIIIVPKNPTGPREIKIQ